MIIVEKERAMSRYIRYYILIDLLLIIILIITMVTQFFYMNLLKMIIVLKFIRMFEIDELYMRKLSTNVKGKTLYVIFKQFITIFVIAHTIGIIFYAIDLALTKETACLNDTSCNQFGIYSVLAVFSHYICSYHGLWLEAAILLLALLGRQYHCHHQLRRHCAQ
jgi:hypothetical protein